MFPEEFQNCNIHKNLAELVPFKSAVASIKARGQYRTVNMILSAEIERLYRDEAGNFVFNNHFLAEASQQLQQPGIPELISSLQKSFGEKKEESVKEILKHFLIEKFSTKNKNVLAWLAAFEKEAARFSLSGTRLIEVFKSCLDPSLNDWFLVTQRKIGLNASWATWKDDLVSTFGEVSWKPIRYAYTFKYLNGSYVEFVVKKERLLLELDQAMPEVILLNLIVLRLPLNIQNTLNRNSVTDVKLLISKLKKYDFEAVSTNFGKKFGESEGKGLKKPSPTGNLQSKQNFTRPNEKISFNQGKKPCSFCEKSGGTGRFHLESDCWFKNKSPVNKLKSVNNVEIETELNSVSELQKNE